MILLSINKTTKTMWLTSLMRDTQVEIADWGIGHLNWATRFGGVDMLINTIESTRNFAVNVDNWAMVDFLDFAKIASMVGPITVTVTKEEAADINPLIREACQLNDAYYGTDVPRCYFPTDQDGTYTISGDQVTIQLELWDDAQTFTFSVGGNSLTMNENSSAGLCGTYEKK